MHRFAPTIVRIAALWLLAGAFFKFFAGSPNDLPGPVREWPFGPSGNFKAAIATEFAVGTLALLVPRFGWWLLAGTLAVFLAVLAIVIGSGADSCGCFGSDGPSPTTMLVVDATLFVLLLASRPWRIARAESDGGLLVAWVVLALVGVSAPFIRFRARPALAPNVMTDDATGEQVWSLPPKEHWPQWIEPELASWPDRPVAETELGTWFDTSLWPPDFTGILYRQSCDHCAERLRELALADDGSTFYVLIRLPGDENLPPLVDERPLVIDEFDLVWPGPELTIPPPIEFQVEGGIVRNVQTED